MLSSLDVNLVCNISDMFYYLLGLNSCAFRFWLYFSKVSRFCCKWFIFHKIFFSDTTKYNCLMNSGTELLISHPCLFHIRSIEFLITCEMVKYRPSRMINRLVLHCVVWANCVEIGHCFLIIRLLKLHNVYC